MAAQVILRVCIFALFDGQDTMQPPPSPLQYLKIDGEDNVDYPLIDAHLEECISFIERARADGKVFVHCVAGINRSASICVGYLIRQERKRYFSCRKKKKNLLFESCILICAGYDL